MLLGAGAAMGPFQLLLNHGANVIAVDLDRPEIWERLITAARNSCGSITFPLKEGTAQEKCSTAPGTVGADGKKSTAPTRSTRRRGATLHADARDQELGDDGAPEKLVVGGYAFLPGDLFPHLARHGRDHPELVKQRKARARDLGANSAPSCAPL